MCDANLQLYFNTEKSSIVLSKEYCSKMVEDNKGLIYFLNVTLVNFLDFALNFIKCFETTKSYQFNKKSRELKKQMLRMKSIKYCLSDVDVRNKNFYEKCWFICDSFKWNGFSDILEGDLKMAGKVLAKLISFFRKQKNH